VGQPPEFSGAVGGPFVVQWHAEPTEVAAEGPLTLTLRIMGAGNLRTMPRPALGKLESFKIFAVEDLDDRFVDGQPPSREFRYRLRPRTAGVKEIPRFKFVYFNPQIVPASRGYQTTYAEAVALAVRPRLRSPAQVPADVPGWMLQEPNWSEVFQAESPLVERWLSPLTDRLGMSPDTAGDHRSPVWPLAVVVFLLPPLVCIGWFAIWRRGNPEAAQLAATRRTRAAAHALRSLHARTDEPARQVASALLVYLQARADLPATATTPAELAESMQRRQRPERLVTAAVDILRRCDEARFAPETVEHESLSSDAERVILEWEAEAWSPLGS
jgi:hypothetical protein